MRFLSALLGFYASAFSTLAMSEIDLKVQSGFLSVINHRAQFSEDNTHFDFREQGGQDTLFQSNRYTVDVTFKSQNKLIFVYQPIELRTSRTIDEDLKVDNVTFPAGTPMKFRYSFPYYRATYLWAISEGRLQYRLGLGLQIRNVVVEFESADGSRQTSNRNVGPVPLFAFHSTYTLSETAFVAFEIEGNYANTSVINGDDADGVTGAIADVAVSLNQRLNQKITTLAELRYVTGGARGKSPEKDNATGDGYASNWIDAMLVTLGLVLHLDEWK